MAKPKLNKNQTDPGDPTNFWWSPPPPTKPAPQQQYGVFGVPEDTAYVPPRPRQPRVFQNTPPKNWVADPPISQILKESYNYDYKADNPKNWPVNPWYTWADVPKSMITSYTDSEGYVRYKAVPVRGLPPEDTFPDWYEKYEEQKPDPKSLQGTVQSAPEYFKYSQGRYYEPPGRDNIAWAMAKRDKNTPQDYFDRLAINGRGYSVPNQMLNFTDTGGVWPWEPMPSWYEPPPGLINAQGWKEWNTGEGGATGGEPAAGTGDTGGNGYGYGGWSGGYGSSNYDSKPAYPTQGYKQDPNIYYQQLVKWVI